VLVTERYLLEPATRFELYTKPPQFGYGLLGAVVYYRTYSRLKNNGEQEAWADTVIRVVEGVLSIRKWWYLTNKKHWDELYWQDVGKRMAHAIFDMRFLPPGRGLWIAGSDHLYQNGALAANNCQFRNVTKLSRDASLIMDGLMLGVGLGFAAEGNNQTFTTPSKRVTTYVIPDSREGWVESVRLLIESYERGTQTIEFDYSSIRGFGEPIKGFGGVASGPEPLRQLHERIRIYLACYLSGACDKTRLVGDVINAVGACVVAGNVRRSAELYLGSPNDLTFRNLKNYDVYPDREEIGWMSNNSLKLDSVEDFAMLPEIADLIKDNGEPGVVNFVNIQQYGRLGEYMVDPATGTNPCAEATLESGELCNLVEVFPTKCTTEAEYYEAVELATIYASTISLLPIHQPDANAVVERNRRIGVSLSGIADWFDINGATNIVTMMRRAYRIVQHTNHKLSWEAGVPPSIRTTVIKPSGSISQLAGVSSGMHYPPFTRFIRRVRVGEGTPIVSLLANAGVPYEQDHYSDNTLVFEFPIESRAKRSQRDISVWQKAAMVVLCQQHFADQMVSNTLTFDPKTEGNQLADLLAFYVPLTKSLSLLPDDQEQTAYTQMPYEAVTKAEYDERRKAINYDIDWTKFGGSDGDDSRFCSNDSCDVIL
jgi:ribonucleoside-triphosphate reductase